MITIRIYLVGFIILAFTVCAFAQNTGEKTEKKKNKLRIVILEIDAADNMKVQTQILRDNIELFLLKKKKYDIIERQQIDKIMKEYQLKKICKDQGSECATRLGKILTADMVVIGDLKKFGDYVLTMKIVDADGKIINIYKDEYKDPKNVVSVGESIGKKIDLDLTFNKRMEDTMFSHIHIGISGQYMINTGLLHNVLQNGIGASLNVKFMKVFYDSFIIFEGGYYYFKGRDNEKDYAQFIPLTLGIGYQIYHKGIDISPSIGAGLMYVGLYHEEGYGFFESDDSSKTYLTFLGRAGLTLGYHIGYYHVYVGMFSNHMFEKSGPLNFISVTGGVEYLF